MSEPTYTIYMRNRIEVNTDPLRRCYNGAHAKSELQWTPWDWLELEVPEGKLQERLAFWEMLNAYAVRQRGEGAKSEFKSEVEIPDDQST